MFDVQKDNDWLGSAELTPDTPTVAGEYATWRIDYTVGAAGVDEGGRLRIAYQATSDQERPQFDEPGGANYVSLRASRPVDLQPTFAPRGNAIPWSKTITIRVSGGQLACGDTVTILLGDTLHGGPGMRAQTYPETGTNFVVQVDPFANGIFEPVVDLGFPVIGGTAADLVVIAQSDVVVGRPAWLHVRAVDRWGNPDPGYAGSVTFGDDVPKGLPESYRFTPEDSGVRRFEGVSFERPGTRIVVSSDGEAELTASSNPVRCHENAPAHRLYWGDLHGQIVSSRGEEAIPDYFSYARDVAAVDAAAHSGNDFRTTNSNYQHLRKDAQRFYEPGRFVTFHGYEWSGNTPAGGDHNVYYLNDGPLLRSSHTQVPDKSDLETDRYPVDRLYAANAEREDVLITPHIGGRRSNLDFHDPVLEPAIEIASGWGRFEWFAREALERGMRVGFVAGSDDHSGRPGWSTPTLSGRGGVRGGLTAYLATELTREGIWEALRSRRCYGTSGPRIVLDVSVDGHPMGSEFTADGPPVVRVGVLGTAPIDTVEVRRGQRTVHTFSAMPEPEPDEPWLVRVAWRGARNRDRSRALDWTGGLTVW